jgi:hypothetical protein
MTEEERPPILKTWKNVYLLVIGTLVVIIALLYWLTEYFS